MKTRRKQSKFVIDTLMVLVVLVVFALISIVSWVLWTDISPMIYDEVAEEEQAVETLDVVDQRYTNLFDGFFIFIFIGLWIIALVASFMIDTHPIFFVMSIIILICILITSVYLGNAFEEFITDASLNDAHTQFPGTFFILTNLFPIIIGIGISILLVLYGKNRM